MRRSFGGLFYSALLLKYDTGRFAADSVCRQDDFAPGLDAKHGALYTGLIEIG